MYCDVSFHIFEGYHRTDESVAARIASTAHAYG
eukprot:COSAG02_NODE_66501_length_255_cov_0.666667_1_plen_32_part_10